MWLRRNKGRIAALACAGLLTVLAVKTAWDIQPVHTTWQQMMRETASAAVTDRHGIPLAVSYHTRWNDTDRTALHLIPPLLQDAFVQSEDKRFFEHGGVDWRARGSALLQNIRAGGTVRGASTISEQVVRLLHPRPRTLWSKWLEGFEAMTLERHHSKSRILEFYLNQVPYAAHRRGVAQAARYYFNRDLSTLTAREMIALAVLVRAPSSYDLYRHPEKIDGAVARLAEKLNAAGKMETAAVAQLADTPLILEKPALLVDAAHFVSYLRRQSHTTDTQRTTLDSGLQARVQKILDDRVRSLSSRNLHNAAAMVADYQTGDVLAWVVAGATQEDTPGGRIDTVTTPRQPGSALKPFLYAAALDKGWTATTIIEDAPFAEAIGAGLHRFRNYSNVFYGHITLREALGNSLNIPALKTIRHVGVGAYLAILHRLGFDSLGRGADIYDDGLALGNGEVTLFEMVQAYTALARGGVFQPLRVNFDDVASAVSERIYSEPAATLIGNILSDPHARRMEFGANSVLNFPVQTAVKTGTSTDYRDAWSVGYNDQYVVGIWMGNLDHKVTDGITGGTGPALAMRSIFSEINRGRTSHKLRLSPLLVKKDTCVQDPKDSARCYMRADIFMPDAAQDVKPSAANLQQHFEIVKPTDGLQMAMDPRVPMDMQQLSFHMAGLSAGQTVEWILNGESLGHSDGRYLWTLKKGRHTLRAQVEAAGDVIYTSPEIAYVVK